MILFHFFCTDDQFSLGIISDTDAQPIIINSHLGRFAIVTVAKISNIQELEEDLLNQNMHFAELSSSLISENTRNWDLDRVAFMDVVIMQCALAEILSFPNIPVSVSLNEYVDTIPFHSAPKWKE